MDRIDNIPVMNHSGLSIEELAEDPGMRELAKGMGDWIANVREGARMYTGNNSMFDRGTYAPPDNPYDEMRTARKAVGTDDIVGGVAETTESFAFQGVKFESDNADDADVFNQIAASLDLDSVIRRMWRDEFTYSQTVVAAVWGWHNYTVRGRNPLPKKKEIDEFGNEHWVIDEFDDQGKRKKGVKRKKTYRVWAPTFLKTLDPTKVVPLDNGPLGEERLAWQATDYEIGYHNDVREGLVSDPLYSTFFEGKYTPGFDEANDLRSLGVDPDKLLLMNPRHVFRHTTTKPDYMRFPDIRLKTCFRLLDMKNQLLQADRASLVGAANYILLVRKGTADEPATSEEIANLKKNYSFIARMPVIISDHRLTIDIICPTLDLTLQQDRYDVIDTRLMARLLGTLSLGSRGQRNETNITISYAVARNMENRRHMLRRSIEHYIVQEIIKSPRNKELFEDTPSLVFTPSNVSLGYEQTLLQTMMSLRTQREISRETILEFVGLDQPTEAMRMENEADMYDDIFKTMIPFNSPENNPQNNAGPNGTPKSSEQTGTEGGRPKGGGESTKDSTDVTPKTPNGNKKRSQS